MIKVFEAFAGIGTQRMALRNLGIEHEVVAISEIDKFAIKSYEAIHGETNNLGDISKIDVQEIPDHDLFTYSFPCQDVSISGKQGGLEKGSGTRSNLLWECNRVIESKKPKYLMLENVKNLVGKKFKPDFDKWLEHLESLGYTNYWQVLNAKDYGIPQNRERVFVISILGEHEPYVFPEKVELTSRLKDVLEDEVDDKFYLSEEKTKKLTLNMEKGATVSYNRKDGVKKEIDVAHTLLARDYKGFGNQDMSAVVEPTIMNPLKGKTDNGWHFEQQVYDDRGITRTVKAGGGSGNIPKVMEPMIAASRGRNPNNPSDRTVGAPTEQRLEINKQGTSNSLTTVQKDNYVVEPTFRIRKLTPLECWRLMGCSDEDFHKAEEVNSKTQLYKQAGNAIVVDVLEALFRNMFLDVPD